MVDDITIEGAGICYSIRHWCKGAFSYHSHHNSCHFCDIVFDDKLIKQRLILNKVYYPGTRYSYETEEAWTIAKGKR